LVAIVRVTVPAAISAALGVYVVVSAETFANVPVPEVLQVELEAPPPLVAETETTLPAHISWSAPALTVGTGDIVSIIASERSGQGPDGLLVARVNVTLPDDISAALGIYVVTGFVLLAKLPVPVEVHVTVLAPPPNVPLSDAVGDDEQTV